jgi:hypothetical protein
MITMHSAVFSVLNGYYLNPSLSIAYHATAVNEANAHEFNTMGRTSTLTCIPLVVTPNHVIQHIVFAT